MLIYHLINLIVTVINAINNFSVYPGLTVLQAYIIMLKWIYVYEYIKCLWKNYNYRFIQLTPLVDLDFKAIRFKNGTSPVKFELATVIYNTGYIESINTTVSATITTSDNYFTFNVTFIDFATNQIIISLAISKYSSSGNNVTPSSYSDK